MLNLPYPYPSERNVGESVCSREANASETIHCCGWIFHILLLGKRFGEKVRYCRTNASLTIWSYCWSYYRKHWTCHLNKKKSFQIKFYISVLLWTTKREHKWKFVIKFIWSLILCICNAYNIMPRKFHFEGTFLLL